MNDSAVVNELFDKMNKLLQEAKEKGYCFAFDIPARYDLEYRKHDPIILWSDDPDFSVSVEDWEGD